MKRIDKVIDFDSEGESGNIFWIMSQVIDYLEKEEIKEYVEKIKKSHSYKEALSITREYVVLNDIRGKY